MTNTDIERRLTRLGDHLDDERANRLAQPVLKAAGGTAVHTTGSWPQKQARPRTSLAAVAVVLVALATAGGLALALRPPTDAVDTAATDAPSPPAEVPAGAPPPGSIAPFVEAPPTWFGDPVAGERTAGHHRGNWVSTAIGIDDGQGGFQSPIRIGVTDGSLRDLDTAAPTTINGRSLRLLSYGTDWNAVATIDEPTTVVSGAVELDLLVEVLEATRLHETGAGFTVELTTTPDSYTTIVEPQTQAIDPPSRRTFAGATGDIVVNEVSEWVRADLAAAATGADFRPIAIGELTGYTGTAEANPVGPLTFLIWSPRPGVVLEIDTTDTSLQTQQLAELAANTELLPVDQWDRNLEDPAN